MIQSINLSEEDVWLANGLVFNYRSFDEGKWSEDLHVSAQQDLFFDCYITLLWGPPCSVPAVDSEVPPAFPAQLLHSTQMSEGAAEDRVWGERGEVGLVSGPRSSGCLSQVNKCVCAHRSGKEGHTHAHTQQKEEKKKKTPAEELLWQLRFSECKRCRTTGTCRLAVKD